MTRVYLSHTDNELVLLLKQGVDSAFEEIYNRYWDKLFNSAYKRLHNTSFCEEIVQEVFTRLWLRREDIIITSGLSNYLFTAVKYNVVDHYRKQALSQDYMHSGKFALDSDNCTEECVFLNDLKLHIDQIVNRLPNKCRSVYQLSRIEHRTNKEIAHLLNISEKTVEGHLTKALTQLRVNIGAYTVLLLCFLTNR